MGASDQLKANFALSHMVYSHAGLSYLGCVFHILSVWAIRLLLWETLLALCLFSSFPLWRGVSSHTYGLPPGGGRVGPCQSYLCLLNMFIHLKPSWGRTLKRVQTRFGVIKNETSRFWVYVVKRFSRPQYFLVLPEQVRHIWKQNQTFTSNEYMLKRHLCLSLWISDYGDYESQETGVSPGISYWKKERFRPWV